MYLDHLITHAMYLDHLTTHSRRRTPSQERLAALLAAKKPALREIFGDDDAAVPSSGASVRDAVREMRELTVGELDRARVASVAAEAALDAAAKALDGARLDRERLDAELDELESRAGAVLDEPESRDASAGSRFAGYDRALADADAAVAEADAMLAETENMSKVFGNFARTAERQRCCALCARCVSPAFLLFVRLNLSIAAFLLFVRLNLSIALTTCAFSSRRQGFRNRRGPRRVQGPTRREAPTTPRSRRPAQDVARERPDKAGGDTRVGTRRRAIPCAR